jgi:DNA-directed RNA polymerase specialized sigma24 family protein
MSSLGSITPYLRLLKSRDAQAAQRLWERFYPQMVRLAHQKLRQLPRGPADEEDVALSAFNRFCMAAERGQFPNLQDRNDLWKVLALITERKARDYRRRELRLKRGGGKICDEAGLACGVKDADDVLGIEAFPSQEPTPEVAALVADELRLFLERLDDPMLREIAVARMEGYSNEELAGKFQYSVSTIERKLRLIRRIWTERLPDAREVSTTD